ncbi:MAG TPA: hypothetical protein DCY80_11935 [Solibacterales bacterium]|nr:hypothetical protein [Bryobacterales bacterium]
MHLLYLDESGNPRNPQQPLFILAGVTAFYRKYQHGDSQFFDVLAPRIDSHGGTTHGLHLRISAS